MAHASEQERSRCAGEARTMEWVCEENAGISSGFLDESGVNIDMTGRYGKGGQRAVNHALLNTQKATTVVSAIRLNGEKAFTIFKVE